MATATATTTWRPPRRQPLTALLLAGGSLLSLGLTAVAVGSRRFDRLVQNDIDTLVRQSQPQSETVVTAEMIQHLPAPVRRYLTYTGMVGKPRVQSAYVRQTGTMQLGPGQPRVPLDFETYYSLQPPGYVWRGTMHLGPVPLARARDLYRDGRGNMLVKAASLLTVVDATGAEMDQGSMMRYVSEMIWFPSAFLGDNISFAPVDDSVARVTFTDHGRSVSGRLHVDADGRLTSFEAQQWRTVGNGYELTPWSTPILAYGAWAGLTLPVKGKAVWHLPDGDQEYIESTITDVTYNAGSTDSPTAGP